MVAFNEPLQLLRYPHLSTIIPPASWEVDTLPLKWAAVGLTVGRRSASSPSPSFRKVGVCASWAELQAKDRAGISRLVVEVDLLQRPCGGKRDVSAFGRRALGDLVVAACPAPTLPSLPLRAVAQRGDMLQGFVEVPSMVASQLLRASGMVRGVFVSP